jgi:hypothetical protein
MLANAALGWDGSYYYVLQLSAGRPVAQHHRFTAELMQVPAWLAAKVTGNVAIIRLAFSAGYILVPLVVLALCWWVVRRRNPDLFVWPALAIGLATVPGQLFFVSENLIGVQLSWVLLLLAATGFAVPWWAAAALCVALFFVHPVVAFFFAAAAVFDVVVGWRSRGRVVRWVRPAALLGLAAARQLLTSNGYDGMSPSATVVRDQYRVAFGGMPLAVVVLAAVAGAVLLGDRWWRRRRSFELGARLALAGALGTAGLVLLYWALDPQRWWRAMDFRTYAPVAAAPLVLCCLLDVWSQARQPATHRVAPQPLGPTRRGVAVAAGLAFSVTLAVQSSGFAGLTHSVRARLAASPGPCVAPAALLDGANAHTALDTWSVTSLGLALGPKRPSHVVLDGPACGMLLNGSGMAITPWDARPLWAVWFDLSLLRRPGS